MYSPEHLRNREVRFWPKVRKGPKCWEWTASKNPRGYGRFRMRPLKRGWMVEYAHRLSWILAFGPIPEGMQVLHECDNPPCVRPAHLFLGTISDNMADKVAKGRQLQGERKAGAKLTSSQVLEIRRRYKGSRTRPRQKDLALEFGVSQRTISRIIRRKKWKHL